MRRGQLSIFLIIAALLVVGAGIAWYLVSSYGGADADTGSTEAVDRNQIERFVEACLESSSQEVFIRIGEQAGYVDPVRDGIPPSNLLPTEGPAFEPFSGITTPYWSYMSSPNDCTQCLHATQQPPLEGTQFPAIQFQAEQAIAERTLECLGGFAAFEGQFSVTPQDDPTVFVTFGARDIAIAMDYPLEVLDGSGERNQVGRFQTTLDIPFRRLYEAADEIRRLSDATGYFELRALEEITLTAGEENAPVPPPNGGIDIGYDPGPFWTLVEIDPFVRRAVERGSMMIQLFGSRDADFVSTGDSLKDNLYLQYYVFTEQDYSDVQANFLYLADWPMYLDVAPGSGQLVKPETLSSGIPFIPNIKRLDFQYDVSYPLLIQLRAPTQDGEYLLQFPIEVNLRRNNPTTFTPVMPNPALQDLCDPTTMNGPELGITTRDQDGNAIAARTTFECVTAACPLGETRGGSLTTRVPACLQGVVIAERDGYRTAEVALDAINARQDVALTLEELTTVEIELVGLKLTKHSEILGGWMVAGEMPLTTRHTAIVDLTPIGREDESQYVVIPPQEQGRTTMDLVPGEYSVRIFVLENLTEPLRLAGEEICGGGFIGIGEQCETIPPVTLGEPQTLNTETGEVMTSSTAIPIGGLTWDETTATVTISRSDLAAGKLRIPVIIIDTASLTKVTDLQVFEQVDALSADLTFIPVPASE